LAFVALSVNSAKHRGPAHEILRCAQDDTLVLRMTLGEDDTGRHTNSSHFYVYFYRVIATIYLWMHYEHKMLYLYFDKRFQAFERIFVG